MKKLIGLVSLLVMSSFAQASVHTWHVINVQNGTWNGRLSTINEKASFVNENGSKLSSFVIKANQPLKYGFEFDAKDDFNVAYTLTLNQQDATGFTAKTCVFVITAKGPANPDIQALAYNGAQCDSKVVPGVGEDFYVQ